MRLHSTVAIATLAGALAAAGSGTEEQERVCALDAKLVEKDTQPDRFFFLDPEADKDPEPLFAAVRPQTFRWTKDGRWSSRKGRTEFDELVQTAPEFATDDTLKASARLGDHDYALALARSKAGGDYDLLYFDRDRDGDLTDEESLTASIDEPPDGDFALFPGEEISDKKRWTFPRVELDIEVDGASTPYAFRIKSREVTSTRITASLHAALYRHGTIELDGTSHQLILVDHNCNGRFDDAPYKRTKERRTDADRLRGKGDVLFVDPEFGDFFDIMSSGAVIGTSRQPLTGLLRIGGEFYEPRIAPGGEKIVLVASSRPMGTVKLGSGPWSALLRSDDGMLAIDVGASGITRVPVGEWQISSFTVNRTEPTRENSGETPRRNLFTGRVPKEHATIEVIDGETVELPFGTPLKALVKARVIRKRQVDLSLDIVDRTGASCTDLTINGGRPKAPTFKIIDPDGKVVKTGKFEYG